MDTASDSVMISTPFFGPFDHSAENMYNQFLQLACLSRFRKGPYARDISITFAMYTAAWLILRKWSLAYWWPKSFALIRFSRFSTYPGADVRRMDRTPNLPGASCSRKPPKGIAVAHSRQPPAASKCSKRFQGFAEPEGWGEPGLKLFGPVPS